jgi:antirestriction protein ArdC
MVAESNGFTSPYWGTHSQWELLDGIIKPEKGRGTRVALPSFAFGTLLQALSSATLYNLDQIDGSFPVARQDHPLPDFGLADQIVANNGADVRFTRECEAFYYYPPDDFIELPFRDQFERGPGGIAGYYNTLFHELAHFTEPRLRWFGNAVVRELRAEITADFLTSELGLPGLAYVCRANHHNHLALWIELMQDNPRMIFDVATAATRAVDFILSFTRPVEPRHREEEAA